jgi:hypothetical protein
MYMLTNGSFNRKNELVFLENSIDKPSGRWECFADPARRWRRLGEARVVELVRAVPSLRRMQGRWSPHG